jgi:hypothetical protein
MVVGSNRGQHRRGSPRTVTATEEHRATPIASATPSTHECRRSDVPRATSRRGAVLLSLRPWSRHHGRPVCTHQAPARRAASGRPRACARRSGVCQRNAVRPWWGTGRRRPDAASMTRSGPAHTADTTRWWRGVAIPAVPTSQEGTAPGQIGVSSRCPDQQLSGSHAVKAAED